MKEKDAKDFIEDQEGKQQKPKIAKIGKVTPKHEQIKSEVKELAAEMGYKPIILENLPTHGLFYPEGTKIVIKAATNAEIRHWSSIDEQDELAIDDIMNVVITACVRINTPGKASSPKDLKEIDRFYLMFAIRELTFSDGQNKLYADIPGSDKGKIELTKEMIQYFKIPEKIEEYYDQENRCFTFTNPDKQDETLHFFMPPIGVTSFLKAYKLQKDRARQIVDNDFLRFMPFIVEDWRGLNADKYEKLQVESYNWSHWKISMLSYAVGLISAYINPQIVVKRDSGLEDMYPLSFRGGIKAIFLISNPLGRS